MLEEISCYTYGLQNVELYQGSLNVHEIHIEPNYLKEEILYIRDVGTGTVHILHGPVCHQSGEGYPDADS